MSQTRRLAAILAADVAGYSRLMGADEDRTLERLKALRRELVDPKIAEQHGRIVKTAGGGVDIAYSPPIGSERTRIRESSSTAMHPRCNVALKVGRLASNNTACSSGCLPRSFLSRMTDGSRSRLSARRVPKSVSAETTILASFLARSKISSSGAACSP
jgi:hypothetical protein